MMSLRNIILCYFCILTRGLPYSEMEEIIDYEKEAEYNQNEAKRVEDFEVEKEYFNNEQATGKIVDIAKDIIGAKYLDFFSSRYLKTREKYTHNIYIIVNFIIQKLKIKHTSLKKYTN